MTKISVAGQTADIRHPGPAHTDGDSIVWFPQANVMATGDIFTTNGYPNIDISVGATIDGAIGAIDTMLSLANDQTKIVPGHGSLSNKAGLIEYRAMLATARDRIAKAKAEGKTEQQVVDANLLADLDAKWKIANNANSERFPRNVYRSLK
jgi:glyoxylase-like metal-dependent hydrolase (beta-lactamase superfamily II)